MATRDGLHRAGAAVLSSLLAAGGEHPKQVACACGEQAHYHDTRRKKLLTVLGPVEFERAYYVCPQCRQGHSPRDRELDVEGTEFSPGVRRMMAVTGSETSFEQSREQLQLLAGLKVAAKAVERQSEAIGQHVALREQEQIRRVKKLDLPKVCAPEVPVFYIEMDGTGVPVVKAEREGRVGKVEGQPAHTREAKLGCVFTQTTTDKDGWPIRDEDSSSYVGSIEAAEDFGHRLYTEAWRRGWSRAKKKVVIGDGAIWIWNIAERHFPGAIYIVDLYHARQHLWELSAKLFPNDKHGRERWMACCLKQLDAGKIEDIVKTLCELRPSNPELAKVVSNEAEYFQRNAEKMRYPAFRAQGLFVGSGVIEAGCKTVVGARLKRSGMFWTVRGANAMIALRCCRLSGQFEDYWESRSQAA
jgi:Uncharacterised protein family (UPF0236)